MVFYFTATGNSLYVAKRLSKNPVSIPQILKQSNLEFDDESIGVVFPVYAGRAPKIVINFLKKSVFRTNYMYFIGTYGNSDSAICETVPAECEKLGIRVDYMNTVAMVDNYLPVFDMEQEKKADKNTEKKIEEIIADISDRKQAVPAVTSMGRRLAKQVWIMEKLGLMKNDGSQLVVKTKACDGCGICKKVCPVDNIVIGNGIAVRKNSGCEYCLACAHSCPSKAITIKRGEKNADARYRNENVTLNEIMDANSQG